MKCNENWRSYNDLKMLMKKSGYLTGDCFYSDVNYKLQMITIMIQVFEQTGMGKQCRPRSDCSQRSSLIMVYTVCNAVCILWMQYSMVKPPCSNFRVITANFSDV